MPGFGDIWGGVQEGTEAQQALTNNYYHNIAMNALTSTYGPQAGDPAAALQAQQYNYLSQQNPQLIQQQGLVNTGLAQENTLRAGLTPSQIAAAAAQASQAGSAAQFATQTLPGAVSAANAQTAATAATAGPLASSAVTKAAGDATTAMANGTINSLDADQRMAWAHIGGVSAFTNAANGALAANPQDTEGAFQQGVKAAIASGAPPQDVAQMAQQFHDQFVKDPNSVVDQLNRGAVAAQQAQMSKMTPLQMLELRQKGFDVNNLQLKGVSDAQTLFKNDKEAEDGLIAKIGPTAAISRSTADAQQSLDQMQSMITGGKIDPNAIGRILKGSFSPGSDEAKFKEYAEQVQSALSMNQIVGAREAAGGSLGLGRNIQEFHAAGDAIANFDPHLSPQQLIQQIGNARAQLKILGDAATMSANTADSRWQGITQRRQQSENNYNQMLAALPGSQVLPGGAQPAAPINPNGQPGAASPAGPVAPPPVSASGGGAAPDFYSTAMTHESGGQNVPNAQGGSAFGYYQFEPGTWDDVRKAHSALGLPTDIKQATFQQQDQAYRAFVGDNAATLSKAGVPINDKNVFMASFLGADGASKFINALGQNPDAPADQYASPDQVKANRSVFYTKTGAPRSLQQVYNMQTANFGTGNTTGFGTGGQPTYSPGATAVAPAYPPPNVQPPTFTWTGQSASLAPPANPYATQSNALAQMAPAQPTRQAAPEPAQPQPSGVAAPSRSVASLGAPRATGLETPPVLAQAQIRARIPDKVMDGRALLAKYLSAPQQRTV